MNHRELLNKYFNDTLSKEEALQLLSYLSEDDDPANKALFREIWDSYQYMKYFDAGESRAMLETLKARVDTEAETRVNTQRRMLWMVAAAVSVLSIAFILLLVFRLSDGKEQFASTYGETRHVILPDGSEVTLNANSSITYVDNWNDGGNEASSEFVREVWLEGEAFFSVRRKEVSQKFIVFTDDVEVEVLGTTFNVNSRRDRTQVVLKSGKVKLNVKGQSTDAIVMKPGDVAEYVRGEKAIRTLTTAKDDQTSWLNNVLVFDDTPLHVVSKHIEDIYGYTVEIADPRVGEVVFTGTVPLDDLDYFLKILSRSCNVEVAKNERVITINEYRAINTDQD